MNLKRTLIFGACLVLSAALIAGAEVKTTVERNQGEKATADFKFKKVPSPSKTDAAQNAKFEIVEGDQDQNGGDLSKLHDGKVPTEEDQPEENFFFTQNADGGRILIDLNTPIEIHQVNTYSWHTNTRGPQVYKLYASDGQAQDFDAHPKRDADMEKAGWKLIASVDTRPKQGEMGGQYGVSIADSDGAIGKYRYLLFDVRQTESDDAFGNTFYSEIDVLDHKPEMAEAPASDDLVKTLHFGKYECVIDYSQAPEFKDWVNDKLAPVVEEWYPKIVKMLPSEGYEAPTKFSITFHKNGRGVAATGGTRIFADVPWFSKNLDGEAVGALVHEMVHVVQQYGRTRMMHRQAQIPGWLVEAIPDYIRWFLYEPQSHGADRVRNPDDAKYASPYRVGANFLNFVTIKYDKDLVPQLNDAIRDGKYNTEIWKKLTGKTAGELGDEWKAALKANNGVAITEKEAKEAADNDPNANQLTEQEKKDGWILLFDGKSTDGWHSFKRDNVRPGWEVKDGELACVDPHNAGDLCTNDKFSWFELQLDYNISVGGNSGILYHVTDAGGATWATGPEFQLEDNAKAADPIRCGWLYALYKPPVDPATGKTLDATKPAGQWNHIRLLVSPEKCEHDVNGVKYFDYVLNSDDFKDRVAHSKFHTMPNFAKFDSGFIALQGDHGRVAFRNIKIRPIQEK